MSAEFLFATAVDVFLQSRRNRNAAKCFFKRLLQSHGGKPSKIVSDKLRSYAVAHRELIQESIHDTSQYANNRAKLTHQPARVRGRGMSGSASRRSKARTQGQRFLRVHSAGFNLLNLERHLVSADHHRRLRQGAFASWNDAVAG